MDLRVDCPPTYPPGCKVVFCGEAPGEEEVRSREGFVGRAGKILQKIIYASGMSWEQVGRTNVVKRAPDGGYDSEAFKATFYEKIKDGRKQIIRPTCELQEWRRVLQNELERWRPNIVVACGNESLAALCGTTGISKYRGSLLPSVLVQGLKVVPIVHPSWLQRSAQWQELYVSSEICRRRVVPQSEFPELNYKPWTEILKPTINDVLDFLKFAQGRMVSLDIETRAGSIACVGLCVQEVGAEVAICVPIQTTSGPYFDPEVELDFWRGLQYLVECTPIVGHNVTYDLAWLRDYGISPSTVHDTMLLFHRLHPELPKGLDFVNMWYTDIPYYKDDGKTWGRNQPDERLWQYNIKDVVSTLRCFLAMAGVDNNATGLYRRETLAKLPVGFEMQCLGMGVDEYGLGFARDVLTAEMDKVRGKLELLSDGRLVILPKNKKITDKQVADYLYKELKLPVKRNRKTKAVTADEDAIVELLIAHPEQEVLKAILAERKIGKALSSYVNAPLREIV